LTGYLLDTNIVSELRKRGRADPGVRAWFEAHTEQELWLSVLVVAELRRGVLLIGRRDAPAAELLDTWLTQLVTGYADRILPVDLAVAERWSQLGVPDPLPVVDGLLAATALEHGLTVVTRNTGDIARSGVACVNPFT
jgi:predicted nucleic acid-binding protein